jgi:GT2 family glycosyltransferase
MKPKISFVTPMKEQDFRVIGLLKSIRKQKYPQKQVEIIITDGGSNPDVLEECKKYGVKIFVNPKGFAEGAGMGKDQGIWKSKGKYVVIAESDIELIETDWIEKMIKPLEENPMLFAAVPRLFVHPKDSTTNRYLSYVGVDPFAVYRALDAKLELDKKLFSDSKKRFRIFHLDVKEPSCMGSNGFMFRKDLIKKVGDYAQDVEFIARLAKKNYLDFAIVEDSHVWHKNVKGIWDFLKKRIKWTRNYTRVYVHEKKDFEWITNKPKFFMYVLKNLLFFPNIPISIKKAFIYKDPAWLLHAPLMFFSTALNIYFTIFSKKMIKQVFS